jgi:hypothetical protein
VKSEETGMRKRVSADDESWVEYAAARRDVEKLLEHLRQRKDDCWQQIGDIAANLVRRLGDRK